MPVPLVGRLVRPRIGPLPLLHNIFLYNFFFFRLSNNNKYFFSHIIVALVFGAVVPPFDAESVLKVILPVPLVLGPVHVNVRPVAIGFVLLPVPLKNVPVHVEKLALPSKIELFRKILGKNKH